MQSGHGNCTRTYVVMRIRGRGQRVDELVTKITTLKISSGTSGGIFAKVCTSENFPLYGTYCIYMFMNVHVHMYMYTVVNQRHIQDLKKEGGKCMCTGAKHLENLFGATPMFGHVSALVSSTV